ncbi:MAG: MBOAT family O-acyltransferase [Gallicola sp.]|nr:MBOAT family O-acyltransferase [Gallicola sp.]
MSFSSLSFIFVFFPIAIILYLITPKRFKNLVLTIESFLFYLWGNGQMVILLWVTILLNFLFGKGIEGSKTHKKQILALGIITDILILCFYKYNIHIVEFLNVNFDTGLHFPDNFLPLGISFFIFQEISYLIDVYRKDAPAGKSLVDFGMHISMFPKISQGPIVKYKDIQGQLLHHSTNFENIYLGLRRFALGLSKKVLLADTIGEKTDMIFAQVATGLDTPTAWLGMLCYSLQLFFDFSGYSDMAIGIGQILGFQFRENFNYPYIAKDISDFWSRWHISLSTFFREYIYFPLGGNRKGEFRTYLNQFAVFFVTGIWHGETLNFLVWGIYHWFFSFLGKFLKRFEWYLKTPDILKRVVTFFIVAVGFVIFRSSDLEEAMLYLEFMFNNPLTSVPVLEFPYFMSNDLTFYLILGILFSTPIMRSVHRRYEDTKWFSWVYDMGLVFLFALSVIFLVSGTYSPFIYFQF